MIDYIKIEGYKSIKEAELELKPINILIGSNGSGKSNFISFFKLLQAIFKKRLQAFILEEKTDNLLYFGSKTTENLNGKLIFTNDNTNNNAYIFSLAQTKDGGLFFKNEKSGYNVKIENNDRNYYGYSPSEESAIPSSTTFRDKFLKRYLENIQIFHFHDTSSTSFLRKGCDLEDNLFFKADGRNLPAYLYYLKEAHPIQFKRIFKTVQSVAPYIEQFILEPSRTPNKQTEIELRWIDKNDLDSNFSAYQFSDGTLRFIALATVLLQPLPPSVVVIDEPELGLHPLAISKLAGMIQVASEKAQVIISTQSVNLVDCFEPQDIITVDRDAEGKQSVFKRLNPEELAVWLDDHTLGELWQRNIINSAQPFSK